MSAQTMLSVGNKYYSYSGILFGDVTTPSTISMILMPNTGLKDSLVQIQPYFGRPVATGVSDALGLLIKMDDIEIYKTLPTWERYPSLTTVVENEIQLFVPRQSKLEVISLNTSGNNTQERGCNVIGYYL